MSDFVHPDDPTATADSSPVVVLVDPTSSDGEAALALIDDQVEQVSVVVLMSGRSSSALHDFARSEEVGIDTAAWVYLEQVAGRLMRPGLYVETIASTGPDPAFELAVVANERHAERIVVPPSSVRYDRRMPRRLARLSPVRVDVAELASVC